MEFIRLREINGVGTCYRTSEFKAESSTILEKTWKDCNKYHDSMPGNGYTEKTWLTKEYNRLRLIADLAQDKLNKEVKVNYERVNYMDQEETRYQGVGIIPVSKAQKEKAKDLEIDWKNKNKYIYAQVQDRLYDTITLEGSIVETGYREQKEKAAQVLPKYIAEIIDLLTRTRIQINEMNDYQLLTK